ncbi:putative large low complexity protein [Mycena venus]|uniref:Putative large low complexity protein n=1 Tax=Mycena venus TaxID=2733690 RepID=A0A8H6XRF5_9AGAR|nr:putative large low complexity protein [Mycena venus]
MSTARSPDVLILVSPFEANRWLPEIRRSTIVYLHLYAPRTSRNTIWPLDALDSFTVPTERTTPLSRQLLQELNLLCGRWATWRDCKERSIPQGLWKANGARAALGLSACSFVSTPFPFFRDLFGSRQKGQGFSLTHMGQILRGNDPRDPAFEEEACK